MELIKIDHLTKSFGKELVLNDISLTYNSGVIYGMIGENGAGKTTLFSCITGILAFSGTLQRKEGLKVGYLPADCLFYSLITGLEYIEFCIKAKGGSIDMQEIEHLNVVFQLPLYRYASEYSTGMKKKLAFMALLLQDNDVYILDEPFNGVDLRGCVSLKRIIRSLKEAGKAIILSSHQISALHEICDCIHYLNNHIIMKEFTSRESIDDIERMILEG